MPLLSVRSVSKNFTGVAALSDVSLDVEEGEIVGVIGPNGSGKTTLLNLITGIFPPSGGDILFQGGSLIGRKPHEIAQLGIGRTFQQIRLFEDMSILENVLVGMDFYLSIGYSATVLGLSRVREEEARGRNDALVVLGRVRSRFNETPGRAAAELPYADKRRLEIARALAIRPKLLLLDEPAAGMAPQEMRDLVADLRQLNADGTAVILVEHKMRLIEGVTNRVIVLDYGQKIAEGPFNTVKKDARVVEAYLGRGYVGAGAAAS
ncbi:MAG: ABC transporter ATP-binding protein [Acidimicrobiia bacterium]|nr:ABC transporter ATP-binding protein [Acidimicrobiia bacterium]